MNRLNSDLMVFFWFAFIECESILVPIYISSWLPQIMVKKLGSWPNDKLFPVVDLWVQSSELS